MSERVNAFLQCAYMSQLFKALILPFTMDVFHKESSESLKIYSIIEKKFNATPKQEMSFQCNVKLHKITINNFNEMKCM